MGYGTGASLRKAPVLFLGLSMAKFTYDDTVKVKITAPSEVRPGALASVIAITEEPRQGSYFEKFPPGTIYSIEYEDGVASEIHESLLELAE